MRKIRAWRRGVPRPVRIVRNILLAIVLLCLFYVFRGCPDMTAEQAYRRAAARNLIGPGEILGTLSVSGPGYDRLLLAETEEGVILYCFQEANLGFIKGNSFSSWEGCLTYREKGETVTAMAAPGYNYFADQKSICVPVILFDDCPRAVRAELDLRLTRDYNGADYDFVYSLESEREHGGYFAFELAADLGSVPYSAEGYAISTVSDLYADSFGRRGGYPATVRLYGPNDELLCEEELTLRSAAGEAHAKREAEIS